jgi:hypothetical protein
LSEACLGLGMEGGQWGEDMRGGTLTPDQISLHRDVESLPMLHGGRHHGHVRTGGVSGWAGMAKRGRLCGYTRAVTHTPDQHSYTYTYTYTYARAHTRARMDAHTMPRCARPWLAANRRAGV